MNIKRIIKKERKIWHAHFLPALIAGLVVAAISFVYEITISNILLFASVGASAIILTNSHSHHLTKLHTTIVAYIIAILVSSGVYFFNMYVYNFYISINIFLVIFLMGIVLFLFDAFHPPAITASLSFIVLDRPLIELIYLFVAIILLLTLVRFVTYVMSQHLSIKEFFNEFKRSF